MSTVTSMTAGMGTDIPQNLYGYEVLDYIGQGAGSRIFVVSSHASHQIYALKHVVRNNEKDERFVEQLENEYEVGRQVGHRGLRKSIDLKVNRTLLRKTIDAVLVMELVDGQPLETHLPKGMLNLVDTFIQTAQALESLHQIGYVHCDLKPNNILRSAAGEVKVIDLGQACKIGTAKKRIQGTPDFISPEQVKCQAVDGKTDGFNFGATLYWCLTGKKMPTLFNLGRGENSFLVDTEIPTPRSLNPLVPENLSNLVMECVKTNPAKRPTMGDCVRRLEIVQHVLNRHVQSNGMRASSDSGVRAAAVARV